MKSPSPPTSPVPVKARDLYRVLPRFGVTLVEPKGGSHWLAKTDHVSYPLSLHNGLKSEIPDAYIRGLCRALGLDEAELRKLL